MPLLDFIVNFSIWWEGWEGWETAFNWISCSFRSQELEAHQGRNSTALGPSEKRKVDALVFHLGMKAGVSFFQVRGW